MKGSLPIDFSRPLVVSPSTSSGQALSNHSARPSLRLRSGQALGSGRADFSSSPEDDTLASLLARATAELRSAGADSPALAALVLLEHATGLSRERLIAHAEATASANTAAAYAELVRRRCARAPLAYVLGSREFFGRRFLVDRHTLIPRPETEGLVALALRQLQARWPPDSPSPAPSASSGQALGPEPRLLDVGTGCGAIAVTLLAEMPGLLAVATDVDLDALRLARRNAEAHGVGPRLQLIACNLADAAREGFDLVVANLPYVPTERIARLPPEIARYEPRRALDGGPTGMECIVEMLKGLPGVLAPGGGALFEVGDGQAEALEACARSFLPGWEVRVEDDASGAERYLAIQRPPMPALTLSRARVRARDK